MNIRIAALTLLLFASAGFAQDYQKAGKARAAERAAMLQTFERGKLLKGSREQYQHLPQVFAVALANSSETPEQAIARTENGAQIVEIKGRLVLFRSAQVKPALVEQAGSASVYPTVVNTRTGTLGVLTGALVVKPKNLAEADAIANSHGLEKGKEYAHLQTVFYRVKANTDIADVAAALQADPRVESAYPEIMEYVRTPK
jgi:hypothetical protein